jgi:hypothetical protein
LNLEHDDENRFGCIDSIYTADMVAALAGLSLTSGKGKSKIKNTPLGGGAQCYYKIPRKQKKLKESQRL